MTSTTTKERPPKDAPAMFPTDFPFSGPVSKRDVAEFLRVSPDTIDRWVSCQMLPAPARIGLAVRWDAADIRKMWEVARGTVAAATTGNKETTPQK